jgi:hypothetical protein
MKLPLALFVFSLMASAQGNIFFPIMGTSQVAGAVSTPADSPGGGTYFKTQTVTLTDSTGSSVICYTTDGSTPTATTPGTCSHGITYSSGFTLSAVTTVMALGTLSGWLNSSLLTSNYIINPRSYMVPGVGYVTQTLSQTQYMVTGAYVNEN